MMNAKIFLKKFVIVALFMLASIDHVQAARSVVVPAFQFHDWLGVTAWNTTSTGGYFKVLEFTFTNISEVPQPITLKCHPRAIQSHSGANPAETLQFIATDTVHTVILPPKSSGAPRSVGFKCEVQFYGPGSAGDWHLSGLFEIDVTVDEDKGAVTGVLNSTMENKAGATFATDTNSTFIMSMRNTPRTILINGGRPF